MKSKEQLKKKLHELIDSIDDQDVLNILTEDVVPYIIKNRGIETEEEDDLTRDQQKKLETAIEEADRGETITEVEFKEAMARWLTK